MLKDEAQDFLELDTLKKIIKKYSQFINFDLYLWESKVGCYFFRFLQALTYQGSDLFIEGSMIKEILLYSQSDGADAFCSAESTCIS